MQNFLISKLIQVLNFLHQSVINFLDAQVLLWLELVSIFALNRHKGWGCNFKIQRLLYQYVYHGRDKKVGPPIVWRPTVNDINNSNVSSKKSAKVAVGNFIVFLFFRS